MLENYKGEKKTEEMETTLNTEVPVQIPAGHTTEAKLVFYYCNSWTWQGYYYVVHQQCISTSYGCNVKCCIIAIKSIDEC